MRRARKGVLLAVCVAVVGAAGAWGQAIKTYDDWNNGYHGYAVAACQGYVPDKPDWQAGADEWKQDCINGGRKITRDLQKLSKTEVWLVWQALGEYDFKNGESYTIIMLVQGATETLCLPVEITDGGKSFVWHCGFYTK